MLTRALLALALLLGGCTQQRLENLVEALQAREIQSCIEWQGHAGAYLSVRGTTATGGVPLSECLRR